MMMMGADSLVVSIDTFNLIVIKIGWSQLVVPSIIHLL